MLAGIMIPARHVPSMMSEGSIGYGSSSALTLGQPQMFDEQQDLFPYDDHHHLEVQLQPDAADIPRNLQNEDFDRSGSENPEANSADDQEYQPKQAPKRKRYHRHTQHQISTMEAFFKECPHPDDRQRKELSRQLGLEPLQVKFWFQNKRTQTKVQNERNVNQQLRAENEKLRDETLRYKEALSSSSCPNCGGPSLGEMSFDEHQLRMENARLREQIERLSRMAARQVGRSMAPSYPTPTPAILPSGTPDHGVDSFGEQSLGLEVELFGAGEVATDIGGGSAEMNKTMIVELAIAAMDEFLRLVQIGEPLWLPAVDNSMEVLNEDEYVRNFQGGFGSSKLFGLKTEATRASGVVSMTATTLVDILMDSNKWSTVFCGIVSRAMTMEILSAGAPETYNGALHVVTAEYQLPTPLVPLRESLFLRYCKYQADNTWAIVDVSTDNLRSSNVIRCQRRPSGCLIQELPNGCLKVIWIEHVEVDDRSVHDMYKPVVNSGLAFGAKRWVATLERQCDRVTAIRSFSVSNDDATCSKSNLIKLAERMIMGFSAGVTGSAAHDWIDVSGTGAEDVRISRKKTINDGSGDSHIILNASTSLWLSALPTRIFNFLRCETSRSEWDILSKGGAFHEMTQIAIGQENGNCILLFGLEGIDSNANGKSDMMIIQESCSDATGSYVIYSPIDASTMKMLLNGGGDPDYVLLLPSGFAIVPDGPSATSGSLLTISFQILMNSDPHSKMSVASVVTVNNMISCAKERIKNALFNVQ